MTEEEMRKALTKRRFKEGSCETMFPIPIPTPAQIKRHKATETVDVGATTFLQFPADFLEREGVGQGVWPKADDFLMPAAWERLTPLGTSSCINQSAEHVLQGLQGILAAKRLLDGADVEKLKAEARAKDAMLNKLKNENASLLNKAEADARAFCEREERLKGEHEKLKREHQEAMSDFEEKVSDLKADVSAAYFRGQASTANKIIKKKLDDEGCKQIVEFYILSVGAREDLEEEGAPAEEAASVTSSPQKATSQGQVTPEARLATPEDAAK